MNIVVTTSTVKRIYAEMTSHIPSQFQRGLNAMSTTPGDVMAADAAVLQDIFRQTQPTAVFRDMAL
jgi:hypothetical protein